MRFNGLNHIAFLVADVERSVRFYTDVFGLREVDAFDDRSFVAMAWHDNVHDVALMKGGERGSAGPAAVHHVAMSLAGGPEQLVEFAAHLRASGVSPEFAYDHVVSQSVYLTDPDGNRIEVYIDIPRETWNHIPHAMLQGGPMVI